MAAEEGTVHHEEYEWEAQRENFIMYYKTENRTLKDSAQCMIENHGFHATPRQWERKVKVWSLEKYTSRNSRLRQIASQGRSIHEVARAGRRSRAYDAALLHPEPDDDRNIRRFARRELNRSGSRSRSRSRSNSFGQRSRSVSPMPEMLDIDLSEEVVGEDISYDAQAHVLHIQDGVTGETTDQLFMSVPDSIPTYMEIQDTDAMGHSPYNFADLDRRFSIEAPQPPQIDLDPISQFPPLDTSIDDATSFLDDISPTYPPQDSTWVPSQGFANTQTVETTVFVPDASPHPSSHVTPISDTATGQEFPANLDVLNTPSMAVPQLVLPPSPSPSHGDSSVMNPYHSYDHQTPSSVSRGDQRVYADFYASVNRYSQAVIDAVTTSATAAEHRSQILQKLASDLTVERKSQEPSFEDATDLGHREHILPGNDDDVERFCVNPATGSSEYARAMQHSEAATTDLTN
jgi:Clr5 domain